MHPLKAVLFLTLLLCTVPMISAQQTYAGFDRNDYPGDAALPTLRKSFTFTGYWLNTPPGDNQNSWTGKRALLKQQGFGFLVLWNGKLYDELKGKDPAALGATDAKEALAAAKREGFAANVLIFLDVEEGGRLYPEQTAYIFAWADAVRSAGARAGVYCSAAEVADSKDPISAAKDLAAKDEARVKLSGPERHPQRLVLWIAEDRCPPSPGCTLVNPSAPALASMKAAHARVWQYALSPRRKEFTASCPKNYDANDNCYAPGLPHNSETLIDLDLADSPNPSEAP
jgi:hypothetical protein